MSPLISLFIAALAMAGATPSDPIQRLKLRNDFKSPEDVVRYYCERDAAGFVWSGLLDAERAAFTLWKHSPQQDSFIIAKRFQVLPGAPLNPNAEEATIEVLYDISGVGDAHGTRMPSSEVSKRVRFGLRKVGGQWKITSPESHQISPIVVEAKFPFATTRK